MTAKGIKEMFLLGLTAFVFSVVLTRLTYSSTLGHYMPGFAISYELFAPTPNFVRAMLVAIAIDFTIWFLLICGLFIGVAGLYRRFRKSN